MQNHPCSLSITRQSIQDIWHSACQMEAKFVFGLLGSSDDGVICRIQHLQYLDQKNLNHTRDMWAKDKIFVQGIFQSKPLSLEKMKKNEDLSCINTWVYLRLNIDTQGCLKSTLHCLKESNIVELPISLVDNAIIEVA